MTEDVAKPSDGRCTEEYLPSPAHAWPIWLFEGKIAIFACLPGYVYQSGENIIVSCDLNILEWELLHDGCIAAPTEDRTRAGRSTRSSVFVTSSNSLAFESTPASTLTSTSNRSPPLQDHCHSKIAATPTASSTASSAESTADGEPPKLTTHQQEQVSELRSLDSYPDRSSTRTAARHPVRTSSSSAAAAEQRPTSSLATASAASDASDGLRLVSTTSSESRWSGTVSSSADYRVSSALLQSQTSEGASEGEIAIDGARKSGVGPLPIFLGVMLSVAVILAVTITVIVILRKRENEKQKGRSALWKTRHNPRSTNASYAGADHDRAADLCSMTSDSNSDVLPNTSSGRRVKFNLGREIHRLSSDGEVIGDVQSASQDTRGADRSGTDPVSGLEENGQSVVVECNPVYESMQSEPYALHGLRAHLDSDSRSEGGTLKYVLPEFGSEISA